MSTRGNMRQLTLEGLQAVTEALGQIEELLDNDPRLDRLKVLVEEQQGEFDLFEVLGINESERVHSNFLAWLLPIDSCLP